MGRILRQYRAASEEGEIYYRDTRKECEDSMAEPVKVYAVLIGKGKRERVLCDCFTLADARRVLAKVAP